MAIDSDREKVLGENFINLAWTSPLLPDGNAGETPPAPAEEIIPELPAEEATPPEENKEETEEDKGKEEEIIDTPPQKSVDEEAEEIIRELLGEDEEEKKEEPKEEDDKKWEEPNIKQELEDMKLQMEDKDMKLWTITSAYKKLLAEKNNIEAINEEFTQKMQIISDNPLMQDLLRGLYLQGKDQSAVTNVEATLKSLLKEQANIDVDELVEKVRGTSASKMSPWAWEAMMWANQVYEWLLWEGDIVQLT